LLLVGNRRGNYYVALKILDNSEKTMDGVNSHKPLHQYLGITQHPQTKDYITDNDNSYGI
ncbi:23511_t:CDS:2, partial [Gigaspora margarita]